MPTKLCVTPQIHKFRCHRTICSFRIFLPNHKDSFSSSHLHVGRMAVAALGSDSLLAASHHTGRGCGCGSSSKGIWQTDGFVFLSHTSKVCSSVPMPAYGLWLGEGHCQGDPAKALAMNHELSALLAKGAMKPVIPQLQPGGFYLTYFLVPKKDGGFRPILDLRELNKFLETLPFHMMITAEVLHMASQQE